MHAGGGATGEGVGGGTGGEGSEGVDGGVGDEVSDVMHGGVGGKGQGGENDEVGVMVRVVW